MAVILGTQSSVWAALALPSPPSGAIPYVYSDNTTIAVDVSNVKYDATNLRLVVTNGIQQTYADITAAPGIIGTINNSCGRFRITAANSVFTLTNTLAAVGDIVLVSLETADATLTRMIAVAAAGSILFTGNAAATAAVTISFQLVKVR